MFVGNELKKLKEKHPEVEVDPIEVTFDLMRVWKDRVRMFPALKIENDILSGIILGPESIRNFVENHLQ